MACLQLLQSLRDLLEMQSQFDDREIQVSIQSNDKSAKATVLISIEGKTQIVEIQARDMGVVESLTV